MIGKSKGYSLCPLPLISSSSKVVELSVDSFTCDPSPFFTIMLRPKIEKNIYYVTIVDPNNYANKKHRKYQKEKQTRQIKLRPFLVIPILF